MDLETLVRPFAAPNPLGTRRITPVRTAVPTETAGGTWGVAGNLPQAVEVPPGEDPTFFNFEVKRSKEHNDVSHETEKVRIENPDDPSQYVIAERIKSIKFREKKPETIAAYNNSGSVTVVNPNGTGAVGWQHGVTQVNTDGTGPTQAGEERITYPLKVEDRTYTINWPASPNEHPI